MPRCRLWPNLVAALALSCVISTPMVWAQSAQLDFDHGVRAAEAGNYAEAFCIWKPLANGGDARAQYRIGWLYAKGLGLAVNEFEAMRWWQMAAELGHADAQFRIGWAYAHGEGVDKSLPQAVSYYLQAAAQGQEDAGELLQEMLMQGQPDALAALEPAIRERPQLFGQSARVVVPRANVRSGPDKDEPLLATLKQDDGLIVTGQQGNWRHVWLMEQQRFGWIFHRLIETQEQE